MVYLIGAGPGDPELLTQKAARVLASADVILYDYLVHPNIVLKATSAQKVCVGKKKGAHSTQQKDINQLLIDYAKQGKVVARLKGGDPMVFGRCGEEMQALKAEGIHYEVIPGITSAISVPTYAGIPITHRDHSHSVAFVTATRANDIENMAFPNADTLIIMMSLLRLSSIVNRLKELRPIDTPIAIIESGTYADERVVVGTISTIELLQEKAQCQPPALIVVGDVAGLHHEFNWREHLPLKKHRFVLFRAEHQQSELRDTLSMMGAEVLCLSLNSIEMNPKSLEPVNLDQITHIIFTSENGVRSFFNGLFLQKKDARLLSNKQIVAIGQHTKRTLESFGILPDILPEKSTSEGVIQLLKDQLTTKDHILIPTSSEADNNLNELTNTGATVTIIPTYNNNLPKDVDTMLNWIKETDVLIFMNSASVKRLSHIYKSIVHHRVVSIGPMTTKTLTDIGSHNIIESDKPSVESIKNTILNHFSN